jgi:hypothetical protein
VTAQLQECPPDAPAPATHASALRATLGVVSVLALGHLALGVIAPPSAHNVTVGAVALGASAGWIVRLTVAAAAASCFVFCPGILLRRWTSSSAVLGNAALLWVPGFLYLVLVGVLAWLLEFAVSPQTVSTVLLVPIPLLVLGSLLRPGRAPLGLRAGEPLAVGLVLALLAIGIGQATWSEALPGQLYPATISRTLEADNRPDSRISYNTVMLVAHGDRPYGKVGSSYYAPYNFYARGPIAGLAAASVVLSGGAKPPRTLPDQPWEPFDAQGFATYRIVLMLLGATVVLAAYGLLRRLFAVRFALAGAVLVAMTPFVIHEVYYTWPKLLAASLGVTAAVAVLGRRPLAAGLLLGLAYLAHPSGLIALPVLVLGWGLLLWRGAPGLGLKPTAPVSARWLATWTRDTLVLGAGLLAIYGAWNLANAGHTVDYFASYVLQVNGKQPVPLGVWIDSRVHSMANTLIPFRLYLVDRHDPAINSYYTGVSPNIIRFSTSYWLTLPFGVGLLYFPIYLYGLARFARRAALLFCVAVLVPFVGFTIYWGATTAGMLREGLHFVVVISLLVAFVGHSLTSPTQRLRAVVRLCVTARVLEVLFMLIAPTAVSGGLSLNHLFLPTDALALALMTGGALGLAAVSWWAFEPRRLGPPRVAESERANVLAHHPDP